MKLSRTAAINVYPRRAKRVRTMPPKGSGKWTPQVAEKRGLTLITGFLTEPPPLPLKKRRGRPKEARGRPAQDPLAEREDVALVEMPPPQHHPEELQDSHQQQGQGAPSSSRKSASGSKKARVDWSRGENLEKLRKAVNEYLNKTGTYLAEQSMTLQRFSQLVQIPHETLRKYVCTDPAKRRVLGCSSGRKSLISSSVQEFSVDMIRRKDRGNDGMTNLEAVDMVQDLEPALTRKQISQSFRRTVRKNHKSVLSNIVKAQASTTKRNAITVSQQFRWHQNVQASMELLRERNTGRAHNGSSSFGELMPHFVVGGDETCLLASNGNVMILGDKLRKKHETASANSRTSITMYRTGSAAGTHGPTAFLPPGTCTLITIRFPMMPSYAPRSRAFTHQVFAASLAIQRPFWRSMELLQARIYS